MLEKIVEALAVVFKDQKTKEFAANSVENIAKVCLAGDVESGIREVGEVIKYAGSIKDILFWSKIKMWLENTYESPDLEVKLSSKFNEDEPKYKEYTKRQLQFIAQIDEEEKIEYYSNLTRAWLLGHIDTSMYFKLAYLLQIFTLEELEYLKDNFREDEIDELNYYIKEFSLYGLIDVIQMTNLGNSIYKYSQLAEVFLTTGLCFDDESEIKFEHIGLGDLRVENTKSCLEIIDLS